MYSNKVLNVAESVRHWCFTTAVEASSGELLFVYRVLDTGKAIEPILKTLHRDTSGCLWSAAAATLLCIPHEWDVAHIVPKDKEAVGIMSVVLSPSSISCFPATKHATAAETLHPVELP